MSEGETPKGVYVAAGCLGAVAIAGVLVAFMFASLFYFGFVQRGGVYDALRAQLAVSQLNELVPFVEMYRSRHGTYPDNLEQLAEIIPERTPVSIYDASTAPGAPFRPFYYERVGDTGYILRGLGADGEAFTADDILPDGYPPGSSGLLLERPAPPAMEAPNASAPGEVHQEATP